MCNKDEYERIVNKIVRSEKSTALFLMNNQFFTAPADGKMADVYLKDGAYIFVGTYNHGVVEAVLMKDIELAEELDRMMSNPISRLEHAIDTQHSSQGARHA